MENKKQTNTKYNHNKSIDNDYYSRYKNLCVKQSKRYMQRLADDNYNYMGGGCFRKRMHNLND